jgi:hypothetical protein
MTYLERIDTLRPVELADEDSHVRPDCPILVSLEVQSRALADSDGHLGHLLAICICLLLVCLQRALISCLWYEDERNNKDRR